MKFKSLKKLFLSESSILDAEEDNSENLDSYPSRKDVKESLLDLFASGRIGEWKPIEIKEHASYASLLFEGQYKNYQTFLVKINVLEHPDKLIVLTYGKGPENDSLEKITQEKIIIDRKINDLEPFINQFEQNLLRYLEIENQNRKGLTEAELQDDEEEDTDRYPTTKDVVEYLTNMIAEGNLGTYENPMVSQTLSQTRNKHTQIKFKGQYKNLKDIVVGFNCVENQYTIFVTAYIKNEEKTTALGGVEVRIADALNPDVGSIEKIKELESRIATELEKQNEDSQNKLFDIIKRIKQATKLVTQDDPNTVFYARSRVRQALEYASKDADPEEFEIAADNFIEYMTSEDKLSPNDGYSPRMTADEVLQGASKEDLGRALELMFDRNMW